MNTSLIFLLFLIFNVILCLYFLMFINDSKKIIINIKLILMGTIIPLAILYGYFKQIEDDNELILTISKLSEDKFLYSLSIDENRYIIISKYEIYEEQYPLFLKRNDKNLTQIKINRHFIIERLNKEKLIFLVKECDLTENDLYFR